MAGSEREINELAEQLQQLSPQHQELVQAIRNVNDYTKSLREPDRYGRIPYVSGTNRQNLMKLHRSVAQKAEAVLRGSDGNEVKDIVRKISALSSANYTQVAGYNPANGPKTLATIEEEVRTLNLDLRGTPESERRGSNMSSRQVLTFMDEKGRPITGLFTPKTYAGGVNTVNGILDRFGEKAKTAQGKEILSGLLQKTRTRFGDLKTDQDAAWDMLNSCRLEEEVNGEKVPSMKELNPATLAAYIGAVNGGLDADTVINEIGAQNLVDLAEELSPQIANIGLNLQDAGMKEGDRIDQRNAAMSAVADLLGCSRVIARSRPMKIIDQNGNEIEGTFMVEAKGLDYLNPTADALKADKTSLDNTDGRALRDMADLQVLDYICGNIDRHQGNMLYQFDDYGKLIGVQGIDNDCSFGTKVPKFERQNHLPAAKDMIAVSESMYNRLKGMTPDELKYALRGYGLTEEELDAAGQRLEVVKQELEAGREHYDAIDKGNYVNDKDLIEGEDPDDFEFSKEYIQEKEEEKEEKKEEKKGPFKMDPGHVRVVPDNEFNRITRTTIEGFDQKGNRENVFSIANYAVSTIEREYREKGQESKKLQGKVTLGADNRCFPEEQKKAWEQGKSWATLLDKKTHWYNSSPNYREMEAAVAEYTKFQKNLKNRLELANRPKVKAKKDYRLDLEAVVTPEDLEKMSRLAKKAEAATQKYLNGKLGKGQKYDDYSPYTKGRIDTARSVLENIKKNTAIKPYEKETAEINKRRAQENLSRRLGNIQEAKDLKKNPKKPEEEGIQI